MSLLREGKLASDLPKARADIKDIRTDATILKPLKYDGDSDKGLGNLHACCARLFMFLLYKMAKPRFIRILLDIMTFRLTLCL